MTATAVLRSGDSCRRQKEEDEKDEEVRVRSSSTSQELRYVRRSIVARRAPSEMLYTAGSRS